MLLNWMISFQAEEVMSRISGHHWTVGRLISEVMKCCQKRVGLKQPETAGPLFEDLLLV